MSGLGLYLQPGTAPFGQGLPGNAQELYNRVAQYVLVAGDQNIIGINFGVDTPPPENRNMPWWRIDSGGNPLGMYSWNGSAWVTTKSVVASGPTADRPLDAANGTLFLDTTINVMLIFERGQWRTLAGSPGDLKEVKAATIDAALLVNPGWIQDVDSNGCVIGGAGANPGRALTSRAYGSFVGEENHVQTINEMPAHAHGDIKLEGSNADNGDPGTLVVTAATQDNGLNTIASSTTGPAGSGQAMNVMQPTLFYWRILKQ